MPRYTLTLPRLYPAPHAVLIFAAACRSDPILEQAARNEAAPPPAASNPISPAEPSRVQPAEPPPGDPGQPPPGDPGQPEPGTPTEPLPASSGPQVTLSGTVSVSDWREGGSIRVDVFDGDQRDLSAPRPSVIGMLRLSEPGPFSVSVPASAGEVWLGAYADLDGDDRPSPAEPSGWYPGNPIALSGKVTGISLSLAVEAPPPPPPE